MTPKAYSAWALSVAALLGPLWTSAIPGVELLTVGRVLLICVALVLLYDIVRVPSRARDVVRKCRVLFALVGVGLIWIGGNALAWGCNCQGSLWSTVELAAACCLAAAACTLDRRGALTILLAAAAGVALGAALALVGIRDLNSALVGPPSPDGRLDGIYGNSNFLGYAVAFSIPAFMALQIVCKRFLERVLLSAALAGIGVVLLLTYSRGALVAAACGAIATGCLTARSTGRAAAIAAAGTVAAIIAILLYPVFQDYRANARLGTSEPAVRGAQDRSGWDPRAQGVIPQGVSFLSNPNDGVLQVSSSASGQGASYPLGRLSKGETHVLEVQARAVGQPVELEYALEDNRRGNGPALASARIAAQWQSLRLPWRPTAASAEARLYLWQNVGPSSFRIRQVTVRSLQRDEASSSLPVTMRLGGPVSSRTIENDGEAYEEQYVESRLAGAELGVEAFLERPLRGIGWERFPGFAAQHREFGQLPTHNEYLRFLAKLGLPGVLVLVALMSVVAVATIATPSD